MPSPIRHLVDITVRKIRIEMSASKIRLPLATTVLLHHSMVYLSIQPETLSAAMRPAAVASNGMQLSIQPSARAKMPHLPTVIARVIIGQNKQEPVYFDRSWAPSIDNGWRTDNATS
jgi:hypothetical protein